MMTMPVVVSLERVKKRCQAAGVLLSTVMTIDSCLPNPHRCQCLPPRSLVRARVSGHVVPGVWCDEEHPPTDVTDVACSSCCGVEAQAQ